MQANYHTHTTRCNHATGTEREYIETAIAQGLWVLGFSDHTPYPFEESFYSGFRMRLRELDGYFQVLSDLKAEYQMDIQLLMGLEAEYYPAYFEKLMQFLQPYPCDYLLLGQHFLENETSGIYSGAPTQDEKILSAYVDQVTRGMSIGAFAYLAHPDLLNWCGDEKIYRQHMKKLIVAAKERQIPLEINFLGLYDHRCYPRQSFWKLAGELGAEVIFGSDAHQPEALARPEVEQTALAMVKQYHLKLLPCLQFPQSNASKGEQLL